MCVCANERTPRAFTAHYRFRLAMYIAYIYARARAPEKQSRGFAAHFHRLYAGPPTPHREQRASWSFSCEKADLPNDKLIEFWCSARKREREKRFRAQITCRLYRVLLTEDTFFFLFFCALGFGGELRFHFGSMGLRRREYTKIQSCTIDREPKVSSKTGIRSAPWIDSSTRNDWASSSPKKKEQSDICILEL